MLSRVLSYFSYLHKLLCLKGALAFSWGYTLARLRGDRDGTLHQVRVGPYRFYFPLVEYFAGLFIEIFYREGYYLPKTDQPLVVLDCGANIGVSLLYIKLRAPRARVICFEPNPAACAVLKKNILANNWHRDVRVVSVALGKESAEATFTRRHNADTDSSGGITPMAAARSRETDSFMVPVEPLSRYITEPIDFLKIDIEGAEFQVLEELSMAGTLSRVLNIQLEYHFEPELATRPLTDLLVLLAKEGFETALQPTARPSDMIGQHVRRNYMVYAWRT